ncbi:Predicted arabinose efflux permease, MFS family [Actinacidiphila yanglinensis]|uniref:Predicted arabinose efflux permease, MFS family n=1 Tax=Actinacidiphila yanglinensis TaxID=310779 RepID=A0A1H5T8Z9_9ACTN|nr:MFS transporter [Actinacidiphila yanglinensis]SEF59342.1 Predicted arabinose efflux permease, MFS family [Actinacidiphila yanglinensis]
MPRSEPLPGALRLLLLARVVNQLGAFSLPFLTALIRADHAASLTTAGLVGAAFGCATIPSRLAGGRLADRIGRRTTIVVGLCGCALSQLAIAASTSLTWTVTGAVLLGLSFELYEPPSQAIIGESVPERQRVRAFSLLSAALAAGGMGAGLLAALLGRVDLRWLFVTDAATSLTCALLILLALPHDRPALPETNRAPTAVRPLRDRALRSVLATGTGYALINQQTVMTLPLALTRQGLPAADAGLLFTAGAVTTVLAQPVIRLARVSRITTPAALALAHLLLAAGLTGYALARTLPALLASAVVWSLGDLLIMGRVYALVTDLAPPGATGRYLAVFGTSWGIAATLAPVLGTQLLARAGSGALWSGMAAFCLVLAALHLRVTPLSPGLPVRGGRDRPDLAVRGRRGRMVLCLNCRRSRRCAGFSRTMWWGGRSSGCTRSR